MFEDENGLITVLLSDGMGSGEKACKDSERVLDLMERMLEAGFSRETALQVVNNSLVLSGGENNMSTLDIEVLDLYEGNCEFIKIGAAASYIKRDHMVEQISTRTLPLGVFGRLETDVIKRKVMDGDYLIMVSDGVPDGLSQGIGEEALPEVLSRIELENPKEIANTILNYVIHQSKGNIRDDMTVLVVGIWDNTEAR